MKKKTLDLIKYIVSILICVTIILVIGYFLTVFFKKGKLKLKKLSKKTKTFKLNETNDTMIFDKSDIEYYRKTPITLSSPIIRPALIPNQPGIVTIYNEPGNQNVHDSIVNRYIKTIYGDLNGAKVNINSTKKEIEDYAKEKNVNISRVIDKIFSRNSNITNLENDNEVTVLCNVWASCKGDSNKSEYLLSQLSDCIENGNVVCPTGVVNRIVCSLTIDNPENFPKTQGLIKEEILNTTANMRNELENDPKYTHLNEEGQKTFFTEKLLTKLYSDYEDIYTKNEVDEKVNDMELLEYL